MSDPMDRPTLLILDHLNHRRLALLDLLREDFSPITLPADSDTLHAVREAQPDLVMIFSHPWRPGRAFRLCRWLKTDIRPIHRVGIVNPEGPAHQGQEVLRQQGADGYWEGGGDPHRWAEFARSCWRGEAPVVKRPFSRGFLGRLLPW